MRNIILKYHEKNGCIPDIGIVFTGNSAVVTLRKDGVSPAHHEYVSYGLFFWFRLKRATRKVFKKATCLKK